MRRRTRSAKPVGGGTWFQAGYGPGGNTKGKKKKRKKKGRRRRPKVEQRNGSSEAIVEWHLRSAGVKPPAPKVLRRALAKTELTPMELADEIAMKKGAEDSIRRMLSKTQPAGRGYKIESWERGIILVRSGRRTAVICPTHASLADGEAPINGTFTKEGPHWKRFWSRIAIQQGLRTTAATQVKDEQTRDADDPEALETEDFEDLGIGLKKLTPSKRYEKERTLVLDIENRVSSEEMRLANEATRRLREERTLALPVAAYLETEKFVLRVDPIGSEGSAPIVPFEYREATGVAVTGAIYLASPETPIPIGVRAGPEAQWGRVMVIALNAYADLTCLEKRFDNHPAKRSRIRNNARVQPGGTDAGEAGDRPRGRVAPSKRSSSEWSSALSILGENPFRGSSLVVGHIRQLGEGRQASGEAIKRAQDVGIRLRPQETWVSPHIRGQSWTGELRFLWRKPPI